MEPLYTLDEGLVRELEHPNLDLRIARRKLYITFSRPRRASRHPSTSHEADAARGHADDAAPDWFVATASSCKGFSHEGEERGGHARAHMRARARTSASHVRRTVEIRMALPTTGRLCGTVEGTLRSQKSAPDADSADSLMPKSVVFCGTRTTRGVGVCEGGRGTR